jgi:hypothetical protein
VVVVVGVVVGVAVVEVVVGVVVVVIVKLLTILPIQCMTVKSNLFLHESSSNV